jgi:hypothetical protein
MNGRRRGGISPKNGCGSCAVTLAMVCGSGISTATSRSFRAMNGSSTPSKNAVTPGGKRSKASSEHRLAFVGIKNATSKSEVTTHDVKKGTLFDDESFIVRHGTEPNKLIAKAAGLEAFIPNGDAASGRANSRVVCSSRMTRKTLLGEISAQVIWESIISLSRDPESSVKRLHRGKGFSVPNGRRKTSRCRNSVLAEPVVWLDFGLRSWVAPA